MSPFECLLKADITASKDIYGLLLGLGKLALEKLTAKS